MNSRAVIASVVIAGLLGGCGVFKRRVVERSDVVVRPLSYTLSDTANKPPVVWRAALVKTCSARAEPRRLPDTPEAAQAAGALAALAELFLGKSIDFAVDAFGKAMAEAARLDRDGLTFAVAEPAYLFDVIHEKDADYVSSLRRCIVIARGYLSKPDESADWCRGETEAVPCNTEERRDALESIASELRVAEPSFYAELALDPSDTRDAFSGELVYLHYPQFLTKRRGDSRDLFITAMLQEPAADPGAGTKLATFAFAVRKIGEGQAWFGSRELGSTAIGWSPLPTPYDEESIAAIAKANKCDDGCTFKAAPVTLNVSVRETADINQFLQYMAEWLGTEEGKSAVSEPIKEEFLPSNKAAKAAEVASKAAELKVAFKEAVASALQAQMNYEASCEESPDPVHGAEKTKLSIAYLAWVNEYSDAQAAARASDDKLPGDLRIPMRCRQ